MDGVVDSFMIKYDLRRFIRAEANPLSSHISPFVFTQTLLPLLKQTAQQPGADVRIINVSITQCLLYTLYSIEFYRSRHTYIVKYLSKRLTIETLTISIASSKKLLSLPSRVMVSAPISSRHGRRLTLSHQVIQNSQTSSIRRNCKNV